MEPSLKRSRGQKNTEYEQNVWKGDIAWVRGGGFSAFPEHNVHVFARLLSRQVDPILDERREGR